MGLIANVKGSVKETIKADKPWQDACTLMPKVWADMTDDEKKAMRVQMDTMLPK